MIDFSLPELVYQNHVSDLVGFFLISIVISIIVNITCVSCIGTIRAGLQTLLLTLGLAFAVPPSQWVILDVYSNIISNCLLRYQLTRPNTHHFGVITI